MAENLQLLKRRIKTAKNVSQIAKAMEMMSASKIKRAQTTVENNKPYAKKVENLTYKLVKKWIKKSLNIHILTGTAQTINSYW
jgi:F-type H+-transporting ATPase subunit gamma